MPGVDRERGEHREDAVLELLVHVLAVVLVEVVPRREPDAVGRQLVRDLFEEDPLHPLDEGPGPVADLEELLGGGAPVR